MVLTLSNPVGKNQVNSHGDVMLVQRLLNQHVDATGQTLEEDGGYGAGTLAAIVSYQTAVMHIRVPDGVITPNGPTFAHLVQSSVAPDAVSPLLQPQSMPPHALTPANFAAAASRLQCEPAVIQAVAVVETGVQGAFDLQGRPTVLFERHVFSELTGGAYDAAYPDISDRHAGGYGTFSSQYSRLQRAAALNLEAALKSASWGAFQIMGENCACTGSGGVTAFVDNMRSGIGAHLDAFASFILSNGKLKAAVQAKNWDAFALAYNGPDYASHNYAQRLHDAYAQAA